MSDVETPPEAVGEEPRKLEGFLGWVLIPAILIVFRVIGDGGLAIQVLIAFLTKPIGPWIAPAATDSAAYIGGFMTLDFIIAAVGIWSLIDFARKKRRAPLLMQIFFTLLIVEALVNLAGFTVWVDGTETQADKVEAARGVGEALTMAIIWIPYLRISRRVKNTFVQ